MIVSLFIKRVQGIISNYISFLMEIFSQKPTTQIYYTFDENKTI